MKYEKAQNILPDSIIQQIQKYIDGGYIYIPRKNENKKSWGENTETKKYLDVRDKEIFNKYFSGVSVKILSEQYYLTESSIRRIIRNQKSYG
jgi:Mor family transcriptional regulator